jgi:hypothetical protein
MTKPTDSISIARSYNPAQGGCCTHAVEPNTDIALCGVATVDGAGQAPTDPLWHVGCFRCQKTLQKRGIIPITN